MTDRKPEVWRGFRPLNHSPEDKARFSPTKACVWPAWTTGNRTNCTVIEDGAVMPLDESTHRVLEDLFIWHADGSLAKLDALRASMIMFDINRLSAFDAARKESQ